MISESWVVNGLGGALLALTATAALAELKSSSLVPKSLFLWPLFVILYGVLNLVQGGILLGIILVLCGIQAGLVNLRKISSWPSGLVWLGLVLAGIGFQGSSLFLERVMGFLWVAVGITKVARERSASLEAGTPIWILLLYAQAVLLASFR